MKNIKVMLMYTGFLEFEKKNLLLLYGIMVQFYSKTSEVYKK
jgi:hypothetical protein